MSSQRNRRKGKLDYWAICGDSTSTNGAVPNAEVIKAYQTDLSCTVPINRTPLREEHSDSELESGATADISPASDISDIKKTVNRKTHLLNLSPSGQAKRLVAEKGVLSSPNPSEDHGVNVAFEEVKKFYLSNDINWVMPRKKDFVSVRGADGKRVHKQKRLLMCNLREAYREFRIQLKETQMSWMLSTAALELGAIKMTIQGHNTILLS
ncbi:hypothetical protein EMCRGX_G007763 [Ephydatia muelleri]